VSDWIDEYGVPQGMPPHESNMLLTLNGYAKATKYAWFDSLDHDLNIWAIRNDEDPTPNTFNDSLICAYREKSGRWRCLAWDVTTDPGLHYMHNLLNPGGTAAIAPGQYRSAYKIGKHRQQYNALVQRGPISCYRDANRDSVYDYDPSTVVQTQGAGLNCHKAGADSHRVDKWSAGCIVHARADNFYRMMTLARAQVRAGHGDSFTLTLVLASEIQA